MKSNEEKLNTVISELKMNGASLKESLAKEEGDKLVRFTI